MQAKGRAQAAFLQAQRAQAALQEAHASHRPMTPNGKTQLSSGLPMLLMLRMRPT